MAWKLAFALVLVGTTSVLAHWRWMWDDQLGRLWSLDFELKDQRPGLLCGNKEWILSEDKRGWGGGPSLTPLPSLPVPSPLHRGPVVNLVIFVYLFGCAGSFSWHSLQKMNIIPLNYWSDRGTNFWMTYIQLLNCNQQAHESLLFVTQGLIPLP